MGEFTNFSKIRADDGVILVGDMEITEESAESMTGITPGTVEANKAVIVDDDKHIDTIVIADGGLKLGSGAGTAVTSTAAELNLVDGSVAGTVVAGKAVVVDANKRIDTIVIADGGLRLGTTTGTAVTSTAAELNLLDGSVAGTTVASKAVVVDTNKRVDTIVVGTLALGAGAGTAIAPTASQINLLAQGVAAGYKVARGTHTPTTASDIVVTGLATVVAAVASLKGAPSLTHMLVAADIGNQGSPAAGTIQINSYKPTASNDVTPIAATTPWSAVDWIAIGM